MWSAERLADGRAGPWAGGWAVLRASPDLQVAGIGGARSAFVVYPERGVAVVVLTNLVGANPQQFIPRIADFYVRDASTPVTNGSALHGSNGLSSQGHSAGGNGPGHFEVILVPVQETAVDGIAMVEAACIGGQWLFGVGFGHPAQHWHFVQHADEGEQIARALFLVGRHGRRIGQSCLRQDGCGDILQRCGSLCDVGAHARGGCRAALQLHQIAGGTATAENDRIQ